MARISELNAHEQAPEEVKFLFKHYRKLSLDKINYDASIVDTHELPKESTAGKIELASPISQSIVSRAYGHLNIASHVEPAQLQFDSKLSGRAPYR